MKIFDKTEADYFESLFAKLLLPAQERRETKSRKIDLTATAAQRFSNRLSEELRFTKEYLTLRVQAYIETCKQVNKYPDDADYREFYDELFGLADQSAKNIARIYNDPLGPLHALTKEQALERLTLELRQEVGLKLAPLRHLINEGRLSAARATKHPYDQAIELYQNTEHLDQEVARLLILLADDAIKEFGNTNQEKKAELERIKEEAEEVLPPKDVDGLKKRAEGQVLKMIYPRKQIIRQLFYIAFAVAVALPILIGILPRLRWGAIQVNATDQNQIPTPQSPAPNSIKNAVNQNAELDEANISANSSFFSPVSMKDFFDTMFNPSLTSLQQDEYLKQQIGRRVIWEGDVGSVSDGIDNQITLVMLYDDFSTYHFAFFTFTSDYRSVLLSLKPHQRVRVTGVLKSYNGSAHLEDCKILTISPTDEPRR